MHDILKKASFEEEYTYSSFVDKKHIPLSLGLRDARKGCSTRTRGENKKRSTKISVN